MDRLPPELVVQIASHVVQEGEQQTSAPIRYRPPAARYATISRAWQQAIEPFTFSYIMVKTKHLLSGKARRILTPARLDLLKNVGFHLSMDSLERELYLENQAGRRQRYGDLVDEIRLLHSRDTQSLAQAPESLNSFVLLRLLGEAFLLLSRIPPRRDPHVSINLIIEFPQTLYNLQSSEFPQTLDDEQESHLPHIAVDKAPLADLPAVSFVALDLVCGNGSFAPSAACFMVSKMRRLQRADLHVQNTHDSSREIDGELRDGLAACLHLLPTTISNLAFDYGGDGISLSPASTTDEPPAEADRLSTALLELPERQHLRSVAIGLAFDWPVAVQYLKSAPVDRLPPSLQGYSLHISGVRSPLQLNSEDQEEDTDGKMALAKQNLLCDALQFTALAAGRLMLLTTLEVHLEPPNHSYEKTGYWSMVYHKTGAGRLLELDVMEEVFLALREHSVLSALHEVAAARREPLSVQLLVNGNMWRSFYLDPALF